MNKNDTEILNEIIAIIKSPGFDENIMYDICELLKKYGKIRKNSLTKYGVFRIIINVDRK